MTWSRRATECRRIWRTLLRLNLYPLHQPRKPRSAAIRDDLEPTPPLARKLRPTLLPLVDLALFPRPFFVWPMFNSVSICLSPSSLHCHLYDLPVRHVPLGSASVAAKDGRPLTKHNNLSPTTITFTNPTHPLGKLSKWPWMYPPSTPHFTRTAHLPCLLPKRVCLWGVHWHRKGWRLVGCTLKIHVLTV